ncbi:SusC/RagA family TonB-linked outer membrane protein [Hymenobacter sp. 15J16-1T3B]|uniref:SusC/RagA family TonB-linked outer membrane protein n=1 Tax=Hymenobacter sp. 15J16-1T3B TaxID=2886941 RepID=UPI001D100FA2|nr:SusC/RagA family TonB-linked outer membrane protein [Hymenobacter sp. 15J16-1T3B]MCC3159302.1 SusC/RagA family TonB-linked outer membrane protein [Hymenobacter sp. 15J16-1T3B]
MKHSYLPKLWFLLFFLICCTLSAAAQTGAVSGRVLDEKQQPLPGVTVIIEGTQLGSSTNADGQYLIQNVPAGPRTVVASFVGFSTQRIPVTVTAGQTANVANVSLGENTTLLNEAVVVGYGTTRRQDLTGSVEQISEKQFVKGQVTNPEQLVQGKVAGVQITTTSGQPGAASQIRIRGGSSLSASNDPLIVIDGVPVDNGTLKGASNPLTLINPNDIESITVLKDASATAIYGSRASNGVLLVTTKRGVAGEKLRVNVTSQHAISTPVKYVDVLNGDEYRALVNARGSALSKSLLGTANTNWQKEIFRTAYTTDNTASVTGAVGKVPYRVSGGYLGQQGLLINNDLKRFTGSVGLTPLLLDGKLRVDMNVKGSWIDNNFSDQGAVGGAVFFDPTQPVRSSEAQFAPYGGYFQFLQPNGDLVALAPRNPVGLVNQRRDRSTVKRSIGNIQLDYQLPFLKGLSANVNAGYDIQRGRGTTFVPTNAAADFNRGGRNNNYGQDRDNLLLETFGKYNREFGATRLELLAGYSWQQFKNTEYNFPEYRADRTVFQRAVAAYNGDSTIRQQYNLISFYGRANLNFSGKYLFTATFRADGSSRFPTDNKFGYFPSAAFAWRLKDEGFLKDNATVSDLKLRVGVGQTGQQDIGGFYDYLPRYQLSTTTAQYQFGDQFIRTLRSSGYNGQLKWETTTTYNAGLDFGFFGGRFYGSVDVYQRDTKDLLSFTQVAALVNLTNELNLNVGKLQNRGLEIQANVDAVQGEQFNLSVNANAAFNRNEIKSLTNVANANTVGNLVGGISGGVGNTVQINSVGFPAQSFYVYQQVYDKQTGRPLQGVVVDRNGDGVINGSDRYQYKSPRPKASLGFGSNMSYGKASLAFTFRSQIGNYVYNNVRSGANFSSNSLNYLYNVTPEINKSGFTAGTDQVLLSDYFLENGSFLRLENVTLGYNFGSLAGENTNFGVSFAVQNAFLITKYSGLDPEAVRDGNLGIDNVVYPRARTFTLGLNLGF